VFAALVLAAGLAPAATPAPLPDRWLLKLVPDDLPPLPDRFYAVTWYDTPTDLRFGSWEFWAEFRKSGQGRPAQAVLTLTGLNQSGLTAVFWHGHPITPKGHRVAELAVHGPLVEFEGRLYTTTIRTWKTTPAPQTEREMLHLGSAVELKDRVWYQAGTTSANGKPVSVEEWRIEFRDDPRTADRGTATLRVHWRRLAEPEGESFAAEVKFQAGNTYEKGRTVTLLWPTGMHQTRSLPRLEIGDDRGREGNLMWLDGMHRLSLHPAPKPRPQLPESSGLVQPPAKKPGK
jgi:hypothetical protein